MTATEQMENSYIGKVGKTVEPVLRPLGFDWKISVSLLSGVAAKEIVVSTRSGSQRDSCQHVGSSLFC